MLSYFYNDNQNFIFFKISGVDGLGVDIINLVDIRTQSNTEMVMRIITDTSNKDREFFTDLNGFQVNCYVVKTFKKIIRGTVAVVFPSYKYCTVNILCTLDINVFQPRVILTQAQCVDHSTN